MKSSTHPNSLIVIHIKSLSFIKVSFFLNKPIVKTAELRHQLNTNTHIVPILRSSFLRINCTYNYPSPANQPQEEEAEVRAIVVYNSG